MKSDEIFNKCRDISELINSNNMLNAREELIRLLDAIEKNNLKENPYMELINHLVKEVGLFPYIDEKTSSIQDIFVKEIFKVDTGDGKFTLHREQSKILKQLLNGKNIALSAPTSFGKSFIIDSYIAIKKPTNVVIIVPTIALMDETRRRLQVKFSNEYNIITGANDELLYKNILIFPQERALSYKNKLKHIDLLVVDEFYKASYQFDKERSDSLNRAILNFSEIAEQRYFLAPNINKLEESPLTQGMEFINSLDFKTVVLNKHEIYKNLKKEDKVDEFKKLIRSIKEKTIIYAGTYTEIKKVSEIITELDLENSTKLTENFSNWIKKNYSEDWDLPKLALKRTGIHNGRLHRSLSQIQIKLFEEKDGLNNLIVTSSIIEGVNTHAQNIIFWRNRKGSGRIDSFSYKNLEGRAGRSFKYFIGDIYLLEEPSQYEETTLKIEVSQELLPFIDDDAIGRAYSSSEVSEIIKKKYEIQHEIGADNFEELFNVGSLNSSKSNTILKLVMEIRKNPNQWRKFNNLNSDNIDILQKYIRSFYFDTMGYFNHIKELERMPFESISKFVIKLTDNWKISLKQQLKEMKEIGFDEEEFFKLERYVTNVLSSHLSDVNVVCKKIYEGRVDFSSFAYRASNAFLPNIVYRLEEYGLPRTISKKLSDSRLFNFEDENMTLNQVLDNFKSYGNDKFNSLKILDEFDKYIIKYFLEGITPKRKNDKP